MIYAATMVSRGEQNINAQKAEVAILGHSDAECLGKIRKRWHDCLKKKWKDHLLRKLYML